MLMIVPPLRTLRLLPTLPLLQLEGYAAASNVRGTVFLKTIGINSADLTRDIVINNCFYLGLVGGRLIVLWGGCAVGRLRCGMVDAGSWGWVGCRPEFGCEGGRHRAPGHGRHSSGWRR